MRILFWGTPAYAIPSLEALVEAGHAVVGVVSQPDRRRGRGAALSPSPVKEWAQRRLACPVFTPERLRRDLPLQAELASLEADVSVVVAYGQILPTAVLEQPPLGSWNGHGSLLPRWRGAAPIQWALLSGDPVTGVGIMAMEEGLDTGPVLLEERLAIGLLENAHQLATRMAQLTARLLVDALPRIDAAGPGPREERWARLGLQPQAEDGITLARLLTRDDALLRWDLPALRVHRQVMGLYPGAYTHCGGRRLKVLATEPLETGEEVGPRQATAGEVLALRQGVGLVVATGEGALLVREAQLEGKRPASGQTLLAQLGARPGDRLSNATTGEPADALRTGQEEGEAEKQQSVLSARTDKAT
ncbi:MAG: methionyl-tRNA formyltransferase [Cyanobacteria bacterium K_Offshore_surface_m2_239]|nr:methionyl-tRNA formyltransferase [Cyanobacteria bacterium K_Offshore_surface_m2_239]